MVDRDRAEAQQWFDLIDQNGDGLISSQELRCGLLSPTCKPFTLPTCRLLVRIFDTHVENGQLDFAEFLELRAFLIEWSTTFQDQDHDRSGTVDQFELLVALNTIYKHQFSPQFVTRLLNTFKTRWRRTVHRMALSLDAFLALNACLTRLAKLFKSGGHRYTAPSLEEYLMRELPRMLDDGELVGAGASAAAAAAASA